MSAATTAALPVAGEGLPLVSQAAARTSPCRAGSRSGTPPQESPPLGAASPSLRSRLSRPTNRGALVAGPDQGWRALAAFLDWVYGEHLILRFDNCYSTTDDIWEKRFGRKK